MAHCEEDGEPEAIVGEQELVEEDDADVGGVPQRDQGSYEKGLLLGGWHCGITRRSGGIRGEISGGSGWGKGGIFEHAPPLAAVDGSCGGRLNWWVGKGGGQTGWECDGCVQFGWDQCRWKQKKKEEKRRRRNVCC